MDSIAKFVTEWFSPIEEKKIVPDSPNEFGYEGVHFVLFVPKELMTTDIPIDLCPKFFELQIKTLFQNAWSEADHDLAYKPRKELTFEQKRMVAFTAAQAWGADNIFNQLAMELGIVN